MNYLYRKIFSSLGWTLNGNISPKIKKCVIIVAPHTSWLDFYLGVLVRGLLNVEINFMGKKELFKPPFGWYFKWAGGIALDRTANRNKVDAIAAEFNSRKLFRLALSPEGTRKKTERWKTGYYFIAKAANVPIIMVAFDYNKKEVSISRPFYPTQNSEEDLSTILSFYENVQGRIPGNF